MNGESIARVQDLVDPGAADAGDHVLVAEQRVQRPRLVEQLEQRRRIGPRLGAERGERVLVVEVRRSQHLDPRPLSGAELAQAQLAPVGEPQQEPRRPVAQRRARVEQLQPAGRHQMDHAAPGRRRARSRTACRGARPGRSRCPASAGSGGSNVFSALIPGASADSTSAPATARADQPRGDLDLG